MKRIGLFFLLIFPLIRSEAQKQVTILQVPGTNQFCKINENGTSVLPSGRYVTPAGNLIRITHDPFGMAISPDGKKAVTLHNGVFTIIDLTSMSHTRIPSYDGKIVFYEPMITKAFLDANTSFERAVPTPAKFQKNGYYPTKMKIKKKSGTTEIVLDGFTYRQAS